MNQSVAPVHLRRRRGAGVVGRVGEQLGDELVHARRLLVAVQDRVDERRRVVVPTTSSIVAATATGSRAASSLSAAATSRRHDLVVVLLRLGLDVVGEEVAPVELLLLLAEARRRGRVRVKEDLLLLRLRLNQQAVGGEVGGGVWVLRRADGEGADAVHEVGDGAVGDGVDSALPQLLAQLRVPVVLHVVVRAPRQLVRDQRPPEKGSNFFVLKFERQIDTVKRLNTPTHNHDISFTSIQSIHI
jgi:hypothetical protein